MFTRRGKYEVGEDAWVHKRLVQEHEYFLLTNIRKGLWLERKEQ